MQDDREDRVDEGVLEAGRAVRTYLEELVGRGDARALDERIADLLASDARGHNVTSGLRELLAEHVSDFLEAVLEDKPEFRPPRVQPEFMSTHRIFQPLPGDVDPVLHAGKYVCPHGDYVWYRPYVGTPIPPCPTHGPVLTKV
jgi:hypothetical protein